MACSTNIWVVIFFLCLLAGPIIAQDYKDALGKSILFFEGQRSGRLPVSQRVKWRGDSALIDGKIEHVNLIGGYYDAGDNVKFGWPMAFSLTLLSWAAIEYPTQISSANQLPHLQRAIRWGTNFLIRAHTSTTTLYTQVGDGNADHQCWERPEDMDTPRTLYKITSNSPGSEVAAEVAAAFAAASIVFKNIDSNYSAKLLRRSQSLFAFADKYRGSYQASCPFYCSYSGYQDELLWAAAWLYKAGGGNNYLNYALNNQGWSQCPSEFSWDNKFAGAQILLAKEFLNGKSNLEKFKKDADSFVCALMPGSSSVQIKTTPGGLLFFRDSSNLQYVSGATMVLFMYSKVLDAAGKEGITCGSVNFSTSKIKAFAKSQVDYILGNNPLQMSYMVGFGNKYPTQLHHRASSLPSIYNHPARVGCNDGYSSWYSINNPNPNTHVGAIVGGPNSGDQFVDSRSDYSHSEPTTYMNAAFVGSVAALIGQNRRQINSQFNEPILCDKQISTKNVSQ
ncbi:Endoglucanase 20 [Capsicum annuum]|uniref:Endoglucanase n=2 Tax=Capsicum annuum TaxID=4072 RepID=Q96545_CAPAN|nr:endoglucanase 18-like precursor [Capsicum annuum]KAF3632229.1 Endoglucanase 20 [Capsicum annuum]KAF3638723.1 Endoglucanase 20 [Capsicum annuum]CAA65826.1 cellulase [Capsicum annuum]